MAEGDKVVGTGAAVGGAMGANLAANAASVDQGRGTEQGRGAGVNLSVDNIGSPDATPPQSPDGLGRRGR